jgi:hypothetical protein
MNLEMFGVNKAATSLKRLTFMQMLPGQDLVRNFDSSGWGVPYLSSITPDKWWLSTSKQT